MHNLIARLIGTGGGRGVESGRDQSSGKRERIPLIFENHGPSRRIQNFRGRAVCFDAAANVYIASLFIRALYRYVKVVREI